MLAIFIPRHTANNPEVLKDLGCDTLFDAFHSPMFADCLNGPDGSMGKLVYSDRVLPITEVNQDLQDWTECDGYWLGMWKQNRLTPEVLRRQTVHDGYEVKLCDGNNWVIPISDYLPKRLTWDRVNKCEIEAPSPEHAEFVKWSNQLFAIFISDEFQKRVAEEKIVRYEGGLTYATLALAKNYRVNRDLVDILGLIDQMSAFTVARVATGLAIVEYVAAQKKTDRSMVASS